MPPFPDALAGASIALGALLVLATLVDVFMTVFMIGGGAGPQSRVLADRAWRLALRVHSPRSARSHSWLRAAGPLILLLVLLAWVLELTLAWALVFVPRAFVSSGDVDFLDRLEFGAKAVIGRTGNSPALSVAGDGWESVQALAGLSGVTLVSVGLAYVLPILGAVAHKRSIAATIHTLGDGVDEMRALGRTRGGSSFELHLVSLIPSISLCAERHRSYPVLHYFHSRDRHAALAPAIAKVALLTRGDLDEADKVDATVVMPLDRAIANLLDALCTMGLERYAEDLGRLDDGLEAIRLEPWSASSSAPVPTTGWLEAYVAFDGWSWEEIVAGDSEHG